MTIKMYKKFIFLAIAVLGIMVLPSISNAYELKQVGAFLQGNDFYFDYGLFDKTKEIQVRLEGVGTSTYPLYLEVFEGTSGISSQTGFHYCNTSNSCAWPISNMIGQNPGQYYAFFSFKTNEEAWQDENIIFYYVPFNWDGNSITDIEAGEYYYTTKFYYFNPADSEVVATSTSNTFYADLYLKEEDYVVGNFIRLSYVRQQDLQSAVVNQDLLWQHLDLNDIITSGYNSVATTTGSLGLSGTYYYKAELMKPPSWWSSVLSWVNPFSWSNPDIITSSSTQFVYGQMTNFDIYVASSTKAFNDFTAGTASTSLAMVKEACNPISGFDLETCISGLFIPSGADIDMALNDFKENISTHFPLGYFNDFIDIISTTTEHSLILIDLETPEALGLGKNTLKLDLSHSLDNILTATTGVFSMSSSTGASSTATFFSTTNYYWSIVIYVLTALYIMRRIIGSQLIPEGFGFRNTLPKIRTTNLKRNKIWFYQHNKTHK